jgi:hypothetical protein
MAGRGRVRSAGRLVGGVAAWIAAALIAHTAPGLAATTITTVAGGGSSVGDGVLATEASVSYPVGLRPLPGGFLIAEQSRYRVRRVTIPDVLTEDTGPIATIAGTGSPGNGQPVLDGAATSVPLDLPCCLSQTAGGDTLVGDTLGGMVWQVSGSRISTVAGTGSPASCPQTPPSEIGAKSALLCFVVGVAASPSASRFLIAEDGLPDQDRNGGARVYEVDVSGALHIVAGGGCPNPNPAAGPLGICLSNPRGPAYTGNATSPTEFVVADRGRNVVWKISSTSPSSATVSAIAGTGEATRSDLDNLGDGGPAGQATLNAPADLAITADGGLLIADRNNCRVRRMAGLSSASTITTVAGIGCRSGMPNGDGGPATLASLSYPQGVASSPGGILISESLGGRVRLVQRTSITSGAAGQVDDPGATFTFESSEPSPQFRCQLDDAGFPKACESPQGYAGLADGRHTFTVFDAKQPADPSPARRSWTVDTTPPEPFDVTAPPDGSADLGPRPAFEWDAAHDATTGVDHYDVLVDGDVVATATPRDCERGVCTATPERDLREATHTWSVRATDETGHARESGRRTLAVGSSPVADFTAAPDPVLLGAPVSFDASASRDEGGPIARYEWDFDGDGTFEQDVGRLPSLTRNFPQVGAMHVTLRVTDGVGRSALVTKTVRVNAPPTAPRLYGVTINGGAEYTNNPRVALDLRYPPSTTGILYSNDGGFLTALALEPSQKFSWRLQSSGPDRLPKTVYVRFMSGPFVSETYTDDIVLDETKPVVVAATVRVSKPSSSKGAEASSGARRVLRIRAKDNASGIVQMQLSSKRPNRRARFRRFRQTVDVTRVEGRIYIRVRDGAGNLSRWRRAR